MTLVGLAGDGQEFEGFFKKGLLLFSVLLSVRSCTMRKMSDGISFCFLFASGLLGSIFLLELLP